MSKSKSSTVYSKWKRKRRDSLVTWRSCTRSIKLYAVGVLGSKCDSLENQSRRNNLLFFGFPAVPAGTEHWDECERKVKEASKEGMGITEDILIERAHRSGCKVPFI